jgi:AcrR family transcriptional regulator
MSQATSVRARVRAELADEIKATARRQLATEGAAALSLRAVAREVGMVSSAVYRYFPSRNDLLTALIIDAYNAVGECAELANGGVRRSDYRGRWLAVTDAIRAWAIANLQEYGLVYGTPIPNYTAPQDTIGPATRSTAVMIGIVRDAVAAGVFEAAQEPVPKSVRADLKLVRSYVGNELDDDQIVRALMAWTHVFGAISFELFGHRVGAVTDNDGFYRHEMNRIATYIGLP